MNDETKMRIKNFGWCLVHNIVLHPIAGVFWAFNFIYIGDWLHSLGKTGLEGK